MAKKEKKTRKKGKKVRKGRKHESVKIWQKYEVKGEEISRKNNFCPRCGDGVWLSKQKDRLYCGKCGYTSFGPGRKVVEDKEKHTEEEKEEAKPDENEKKPEGAEEENRAESEEKPKE